MIRPNKKSVSTKTFFLLFLLIVLWLFPIPLLALESDSLWFRAVEIRERNNYWLPGEMQISSWEYNSSGRLENREVVVLSVSGDSMDSLEYTILSAHKNGIDITEVRIKEEEKRRNSGNPQNRQSPDPFDREVQSLVKQYSTGETKIIEGRRAAEYRFSLPGEKRFHYSGSAWLDTETAVPLLVELVLDPLPPLVTEFYLSTKYSPFPDLWYPLEVEMKAAGTFLFIKRRFETSLQFSKYRLSNDGKL